MKKLTLLIIPFLFTACTTKELIVTKKYSNYGIETNKQLLIKHKYQRILEYNKNGFFIVQGHNDKYGIISINDVLLLDIIYDEIAKFYNGFAKIKINNKTGLINSKAQLVLKPQFDKIDDFTGQTAIIKQNNNFGCIDKEMNIKIEPIYSNIYPVITGFRKIKRNNLWGLIDNKCNIIAPAIYDSLEIFADRIKVEKQKQVKFIDLESN